MCHLCTVRLFCVFTRGLLFMAAIPRNKLEVTGRNEAGKKEEEGGIYGNAFPTQPSTAEGIMQTFSDRIASVAARMDKSTARALASNSYEASQVIIQQK